MSSLSALYTELSRGNLPETEKPKLVDAGRENLKLNWRTTTITLEFFEWISSRIDELEAGARAMAINKEHTDNVIANLNRSDELRKVLEYGRKI